MVDPVYLDEQGNRLPADVPGEQVAISRYDIPIKQGIRFQPHPAFALDEQGEFRYYPMRAPDLNDAFSIADFAHTGSRELTAHDYVYAFKRLASPRLASPVLGVMAEHIRGFKEFSEELARVDKQEPRPQWLDLRPFTLPGVRALDKHTLRIEVNGELAVLERAIPAALDSLAVGAVLLKASFVQECSSCSYSPTSSPPPLLPVPPQVALGPVDALTNKHRNQKRPVPTQYGPFCWIGF